MVADCRCFLSIPAFADVTEGNAESTSLDTGGFHTSTHGFEYTCVASGPVLSVGYLPTTSDLDSLKKTKDACAHAHGPQTAGRLTSVSTGGRTTMQQRPPAGRELQQ